MLLDIEVGGTHLPGVGTGKEAVHEGRGRLTTQKMRFCFRDHDLLVSVYFTGAQNHFYLEPCHLAGNKHC